MHRFYIPPEHWNPDALILTGSEVHHARDVLRLNPGAKAVLFNGEGREITAEVVEVGREEVRLRKLHETATPPLRCRITLGQAIPKGKNMDFIVQKAVEIGAAEIAPLISERTIVDLDPKEAVQKQAKWQQVAIEAAKQCGQNWLPQVQRGLLLRGRYALEQRTIDPEIVLGHTLDGEAAFEAGSDARPAQALGALRRCRGFTQAGSRRRATLRTTRIAPKRPVSSA
jgi:RsmE family RNA methyltransferase